MEKIRQKLLAFISSPKDGILLSGIAIGVYMLLYYYSKNFGLASSWEQLGVFIAYYFVVPTVVLLLGYRLFTLPTLLGYRKHYLFIAVPLIVVLFLLQLIIAGPRRKSFFLGLAIVLLFAGAKKFAHYHKLFIVLLFVMAACSLPTFFGNIYNYATASDAWRKLPDDIEQVQFKTKPNIYYIQPDGYASPANLKNANYNFDNKDFEQFLSVEGFTVYPDFRSNYNSTLLSNTSAFSMRHHYARQDIEDFWARRIIVGDNPVLRILKNNGYTTHFVTEKPYLIMNRPKLGYDSCNFTYSELPYLKDAMGLERDVFKSLKEVKPTVGPQFYFIEKMTPSHVSVFSKRGKASEKEWYLERLQKTNIWLMQVVSYIEKKDPDALIIIGADHGGFVGFDHTLQSMTLTKDPLLVKSIFGSMMAIKWGNEKAREYDGKLHTSVNLFRVIFAYLSQDKKYLNHTEADNSFVLTHSPGGLYKYINDKGEVVLQKQ